MSAKRTSWNEFSSSMASAVICLSTGRKFNFSKAQVGDLSSHTTKYLSLALTQKVFGNMRRVGKGFSGVETPLFESMIVAQQADDVAAVKKTAKIEKDAEPAELKEVVKVVTTAKLMTELVTAATITAATIPITAAPSAARRRKEVVIRDPEETATPSKEASSDREG
nr:hypothetical protein [Tanacetum cinerariifolium]